LVAPPRALGEGKVCRQVSKIHKYWVVLPHVCLPFVHNGTISRQAMSPCLFDIFLWNTEGWVICEGFRVPWALKMMMMMKCARGNNLGYNFPFSSNLWLAAGNLSLSIL
jgi:hypothetical protein